MSRDVLGLHLVKPGETAGARLRRVRDQLRAADAHVIVEPDTAEPDSVRELRRRAEELLAASRYEEAEEAFLEAIEVGLQEDYFAWHAAVNLVNCHRFLGRREDAAATAEQLEEMYAEQPEHPIRYLVATQLGAIAADAYDEHGDPEQATAAWQYAQAAYDWQMRHRELADGLRAYNLVVALLRLDRLAEAKAVHEHHRPDEGFRNWCRQGDKAALIAERLGTDQG